MSKIEILQLILVGAILGCAPVLYFVTRKAVEIQTILKRDAEWEKWMPYQGRKKSPSGKYIWEM